MAYAQSVGNKNFLEGTFQDLWETHSDSETIVVAVVVVVGTIISNLQP